MTRNVGAVPGGDGDSARGSQVRVRRAAPSVRPRLVALDVDDTLLEADLTLRDECIAAIAEVRRRGVEVAIATGRMFRSALPYARRLGLDGYVIAYNGALVRRPQGETLWHRQVPQSAARRLIEIARGEDVCLNLYVDDTLFVEDADDERVRYYIEIAGVEPHAVGDLTRALARGEPTKCLMVLDAEEVPALIQRLRPLFPELQVDRSKPRFIEFTRAGVHKEVAVAAVARAYGIPMEAVMAIGDGENDATMLARAGWGVAVANASDGAKRAADAVTEAPRGLGVCEALERYVLS